MNRIFAQVPIPRHHGRNPVARHAAWFTWSPKYLRQVDLHLDRIRRLPTADCVNVAGCEPYSSSYTYRLSRLPVPLAEFAIESATALLKVHSGREMRFMTGMLDAPVDRSILGKSFALLRAGVVASTRDHRTALNAPVKTERHDDGFPLHADLFLTDRLWLVFDDVPKGSSGKSLFLRRDLLDSAVQRNGLIPAAKRNRLKYLLSGKAGADSFDECFDILHSPRNPWSRSLAGAMKRDTWSIKLRSGEGYLMNDRCWLHGRTGVNGRVSAKRFHRLVYGRI